MLDDWIIGWVGCFLEGKRLLKAQKVLSKELDNAPFAAHSTLACDSIWQKQTSSTSARIKNENPNKQSK